MKLYHLDRNGTLDIHNDIRLTPLHNCPSQIRTSAMAGLFPNGLSYQGLQYLNAQVSVKYGIGPLGYLHPGDIQNSLRESSDKMLELDFELIRRLMFPSCQSRYTALFAVKDPSEFSLWPELQTAINSKIVEITVPDDLPRYDSLQLRGGVSFCNNTNPVGFYFGYLPTGVYDQALRYWGNQATETPRWEYLIPLPISAANLRVLGS